MTMNIGVLGAGSWGCTLASLLSEKGCSVTLWEFDPEQAKHLTSWRTLSFFPHLVIPKSVAITSELSEAVSGKDMLVFVVPSHAMRATAAKLRESGADLSNTVLVTASKGIEAGTLKRMSEVISGELPRAAGRIVALSGPTHAEEVSQKIPSTATAASKNPDAAKTVQETFITPYFRIYTNDDIAGVETAASLKNVLALAAGISDGLGLGDNTKAALVTRGLREIVRIGVKMGGKPATFFGLAGLGDLIVTAFSRHSRNRALGEKIGKGKSLSQAEKELVMIAEGVRTAKSVHDLAQHYSVELPIMEQVYRVLYDDKSPRVAVNELMTREPKHEFMSLDVEI